MAPYSSTRLVKKPKAKWSMTVMMNARDLSRDDDFLSHLLVEHLGTDESPLQVHKMDPSRRLPKHDPADVLAIVKKNVVRRGGSSTSAHRVKRAVDALLELAAVKQYLHKRSVAQINAFATHASRYFELYLPTGSIEISHTSRYSHRTGKSELCILATTSLKVGQVISDLKGSLAHLTVEEDEELKKTDSRRRDGGIRRDFSVIHSNQKNKSHLFLGPARFVNHDCDHNVELFRDGRVITFRVIKPIAAGQEVTAHYGEGYFGKGNRHCLCQTCERLGRGGYTPEEVNSDHELEDDSSTDEETREERIKVGLGLNAKGNPNERRTRRGVYAILPEEDTDDEDRVGATEKVAVVVPQQSTGSEQLDIKPERSVSSSVAPPSSSTSLSPLTTPTPAAVPEDIYTKQHDRQISASSSSLSSLPDSDNPESQVAGSSPAISNSQSSPLQASTSNDSSMDTVPLISKQPDIGKVGVTRASLRMSTRSATALQHKGKSKEDDSSKVGTRVKQANAVSAVDKPGLRGSRSTASVSEVAKQQPKTSESSGRDLKARPVRQTRHSTSTSAPPKGSENGTPKAKGSTPVVASKSSAGKSSNSASPALDAPKGKSVVTKTAESKAGSNVPRCDTCSAEMTHLIGTKFSKKAVHKCARCKRHFAIFSAPWPNRNPSAEELSSSSDSSSAETVFEAVREKSKDIARMGHKFKYSRKYVEIKHPSVERPVKRRKTDSDIHLSKFHHVGDQPRNANGQFYSTTGSTKNGTKPQHIFSLPGDVMRSKARAHRALSREKLKNLGFSSTLLGTKRRWADAIEDPEQRALDRIRSRRRDSDEQLPANASLFLSGARKIIRRFPSLPTLPPAKPLAALCARPSPNLFARHSWAFSDIADFEPAAELSKDTNSELTELPDSETKTGASAGQKRKREDSSKHKGRSFFMKDEKKPMPKGWVLVTDSSEETGEDDGDEEADPAKNQKAKGGPTDAVAVPKDEARSVHDTTMAEQEARDFYPKSESDSPPASTPSLAHTPSSRATSTPTQSSGTLVEEHADAPTTAFKRVASAMEESSTFEPSKRRKISHSPSKSQSVTDSFVGVDAKFPQDMEIEMSNDTTMPRNSTSPELEANSDIDVKSGPGLITMINASFSTPSGNKANGKQDLVPIVESGSIFPDCEMDIFSIDVPDSTSKRAALETSNLIHGTAFSYGHPDARTTWKPKYHFSELEGWDFET